MYHIYHVLAEMVFACMVLLSLGLDSYPFVFFGWLD